MSTNPTLKDFYRKRFSQYATRNLKPKTRQEYERLFDNHLDPRFGERKLHTLTRKSIAHWHRSMAKDTPVQANRALAVLSSILSLAAERCLLEVNPAQNIRRAKEASVTAYLSPDELTRFRDAVQELDPTDGAFLLFLLFTGARPGEVKNLRWEWLAEGGVFQLPDSKTGARNIFAPPSALSALAPVAPNGSRCGRIFPADLNPTAIWRKVRKATGIRQRLYDLRHTFASEALSAGLSLEVIGQMLGHKRYDTTKRYAHLQTETGQAAAAQTARQLETRFAAQ